MKQILELPYKGFKEIIIIMLFEVNMNTLEITGKIRDSKQRNRNHKTEANGNLKTKNLKFKNHWVYSIAEWR